MIEFQPVDPVAITSFIPFGKWEGAAQEEKQQKIRIEIQHANNCKSV
jgi:hypothetical protein